MEFRVLGGLEVDDAGKAIALGPRLKFLLAILLARRGDIVSADYLIDALWAESPPANARALLHVRVSELRRSLGGGAASYAGITTHTAGYKLLVDPGQVDCDRFESLCVEGRAALARGDYDTAYASLGQALALWRGTPFKEFQNEAFAQPAIAHYGGLFVDAHEDRFAAALALGQHGEVLRGIPPLLTGHPLREGLWSKLILAQYRCGRQGEALETYQKVKALLSDTLGIDPGKELQQLYLQILNQDPVLDPPHTEPPVPAVPACAVPPSNLPSPLTAFIGRSWELNEVQAMIGERRLVTLLGSGGTGKSRLAVEAARAVLADFGGGVWFAELPPLQQPGITVRAIARCMGLSEHPAIPLEQVVQDSLSAGRVLVILDNCEHLVEEVAGLVHRLLQACPELSILVTSQERLGVPGEALCVMQGLSVPGPGTTDPLSIMEYDAVRLLIDRASAVRPGFRLNEGNSNAVAQICRTLDGLPLAIELAAALVNVLDVSQIAGRLTDRFQLLARSTRDPLARHQTLRAALEWSYGLLTAAEQRLFRSVSVFVGGFSLDAAEAVCADTDEGPGAVVITLTCLVDKSLIISEDDAESGRRYKVLDSLRIFGLDRLRWSDELDSVRARHTRYYLALAEEAAAWLRHSEQESWLHRLELEHDNIRAALECSLGSQDAETAARIVGSIYPLWDLHGHYREGRRWMALVLRSSVSAEARTKVLLGLATLATLQGDRENAATACGEAAELARNTGDRASLAHALQYLGLSLMYAGEYAAAEETLGESLENALAVADVWLESWAYVFLAAVAVSRGHYGRAKRLAGQFLATPDSHRDAVAVGWANLILGASNWYGGERDVAISFLNRGFHLFNELGAMWGLSVGFFLASQLAGARGDIQQQVALMSAGEQLRTEIGVGLFPFMIGWIAEAGKDARNVVGRDVFDQCWATGRALPFDAALASAHREYSLATQSLPTSE